jgi:hypothetical protein
VEPGTEEESTVEWESQFQDSSIHFLLQEKMEEEAVSSEEVSLHEDYVAPLVPESVEEESLPGMIVSLLEWIDCLDSVQLYSLGKRRLLGVESLSEMEHESEVESEAEKRLQQKLAASGISDRGLVVPELE